MKISWTIEKPRGNYRPSLNYTIILEDFEQALAVPSINIQSLIPKINCSKPYCMPNECERATQWQPADFHWISVPYFKEGIVQEHIKLPFRESGEYPEVESSFALLREKYEEVVKEAYSHEPISISEELDISSNTKQAIAASLTAKKMLSFCV